MTIDEKIVVLQAYKEGKTLQRAIKHTDFWVDIDNPEFDFTGFNYRIKPEPHYRPFESAEEVMEAIKEHGDWLDSHTGGKANISQFNDTYIWIGAVARGTSFENAFVSYCFEKDGTPFGKLVED